MSTHNQPKLFADPIGRVYCIHKHVEIGLLYRWDNGELQLMQNGQAGLGDTQDRRRSHSCD